MPKQKKPTTAELASSMDQLLSAMPQITQQLKAITDRQAMMESQLVASSRAGALGLSQPLSSTVLRPSSSVAPLTKALNTPPPRTRPLTQMAPLSGPPVSQPQELLYLELEKGIPSTYAGGDLARAVLVQSQALTSLSQIASSSQDPMTDLAGSSQASGTRGALGRAKLQAELATHSGSFFCSVLAAMARRMQPSTSAQGTPAELLARGITGPLYMEKFGGYGKQRELGMILYQLMGALEFAQAENWGALKDSLALLAVAIDQAVLDGGRFDLAALLTLQEEAPASIYVHRLQSSLSRSRAFTPLADQRWVTVSLAFLKEMDVITTKRLELANPGGGGQPSAKAAGQGEAPKAKAFSKKKAKEEVEEDSVTNNNKEAKKQRRSKCRCSGIVFGLGG